MLALKSLVPNVDDFLALEVEEVAGVLLVVLNDSSNKDANFVLDNGQIFQPHFFSGQNHVPEYPDCPERRKEIDRALMEAWNWLQSAGFLVRDMEQPSNSFFLSRRARRIKTREEYHAYRNASLLPKAQLHPLIATRVYPAFLRGEYDTAVFQAFREVEVAVRKAGKFQDNDYGTPLMRDAFRSVNVKQTYDPGPLTDVCLPTAEQEGVLHLFSGAIAAYKNPQSHRNVPTHPIDAAEVIMFASHLLRIVDQCRPADNNDGPVTDPNNLSTEHPKT